MNGFMSGLWLTWPLPPRCAQGKFWEQEAALALPAEAAFWVAVENTYWKHHIHHSGRQTTAPACRRCMWTASGLT